MPKSRLRAIYPYWFRCQLRQEVVESSLGSAYSHCRVDRLIHFFMLFVLWSQLDAVEAVPQYIDFV
jgi:hypothetical protein